MRVRLHLLLIGLLVAGVVGCDRTPPTPTPTPASPTVPAAVVAARDTALAYLTAKHPQSAPAAGLVWHGQNETPSNVSGVSYFGLSAGEWLMSVNVPVVASDRYWFEIDLRNEKQGVFWSGTLAENLAIAESNLNVAPAVRMARDAILAHLRERSPDTSPPASLVWAGQRTTPSGSDDEYCRFEAPDWTMYISFGTTQPDQTVFLAELYKGGNSLVWRGQVDPEGSVLEILR